MRSAMLRKDFIVRQLEEFGKVMASVISFRKNKDWENWNEQIQQAVNRFTGMEIHDIEMMSDADFKLLITEAKHLSNDQVKILADLLYERFLGKKDLNETEKNSSLLLKAECLYKAHQNSSTQNEYNLDVHYKLQMIQLILKANQPNQQ